MEASTADRVLIADRRGTGSYLRATWHPDRRVVVLSHWRDDVCTATTAVGLEDIPKLISLLVAALSQSAFATTDGPGPDRLSRGLAGIRMTLRRVLRRDAA